MPRGVVGRRASCDRWFCWRWRKFLQRSIAGLVVGVVAWAVAAWAELPMARAQPPEVENVQVRHLVVTVNKSRTIHIEKAFASTMIGLTNIANALPLSDHSLYVLGKKVGTTNMSVVDKMGKLVSVID